MPEPTDLHQVIAQSVRKIAASTADDNSRIGEVYRLLSHALISIAEKEQLHFSTLFSRIAFLSSKFQIPALLTRVLHGFRIQSETSLSNKPLEGDITPGQIWQTGAHTLLKVAEIIFGKNYPADIWEIFAPEVPILPKAADKTEFVREVRVVAVTQEPDFHLLHCLSEHSGKSIKVSYGDPGRSDLFRENIEKAIDLIGLPLTLNLVDCEFASETQTYSPNTIVIEPDFLVDVTAIAECFKETGADSRYYLLSKYLPREIKAPILLGHIVNFFLDELIHDPGVQFSQLIPDAFKLNPTAFSTLSDEQIWELVKKAEMHFENLQRTVHEDFQQLEIDPKSSYIEPSFYSPAFGIQGRLDLYQPETSERAHIIELKSARPYMPNAYGLSSTHYTQTLLYGLMISAVHQFRMKSEAYILYSSQTQNALRFAPPVKALQREAVKLRNEIFLIERTIQSEQQEVMIRRIKPKNFPGIKGFISGHIEQFHKAIEGLDVLESQYFHAFTSFVAGEHYLAKVGIHGSDRVRGLAGMWIDPIQDKEERFGIMKDLAIHEIVTDHDQAIVTLMKGQDTNILANFRVGDIAVLYPETGHKRPVLRNQIFKCTITANSGNTVNVRLRNKQANYGHLKSHDRWMIEHDVLDSGFNSMQRALFAFAQFRPEQRALFLGRTPPPKPQTGKVHAFPGLTANVQTILQRIIAAKGYFLLWGPPGTGKTSVVLHRLVRHYLEDTQERILVMAYTNRAVDEICAAIDLIHDSVRDTYVRVGSRVSTKPEYRDQLLTSRLSQISRRRDLKAFLNQQRIIVSTVSSMAGKMEILDLLSIETVIIDEASQILEPMFAGLLPRFKKWILIGDHKQLPAVVTQKKEQSVVDTPALVEIGLADRRTSYFERLYLRCLQNDWDWATGQLLEQGRMHEEIMQVPGEIFYDGKLRILASGMAGGRSLTGPLRTSQEHAGTSWEEILRTRRMIYIPSRVADVPDWSKTHDDEADICVQLISHLDRLYAQATIPPTIGIITTFRAQIANIRDHLERAGFDPDRFTIDTVERYQGSARDIILLSLSIHHASQIERIVSLSSEGVDRKLNVAITRAREQFVMIASPVVEKYNAVYRKVIERCYRLEKTASAINADSA